MGLTRRSFVTGAAAVASSACLTTRAARAQQAVNVGVILPLSGANAQFGTNARNGIQLVADEINAAGGIKALGGAKLTLVVADSTSTPTTAATVAQRLITQNQVVAVLGAFASSLTIAISEVTERRGVPLLTMSFSDQITGRGFKHVFQVVPRASVIGKAQLDYTLAVARAAGEKIERAALLYEDTAYGTSQATGLRAAAKAAGVDLVMDEAYPLGITDVTPLVNRLRSSGAQVVFPVSYLNDSILIIRSMRQQQLDIPAVGGAAGYVIPDFERALGPFVEGVLSINTSNYDLAPRLTGRFRERFGDFMVHEAIEHAVTMDVLARALETARSTRADAVRAALAATSVCDGWAGALPGGCVDFDETGLNTKTYPVMVQWQGKELVTVYPEKDAKGKAAWRGRRG